MNQPYTLAQWSVKSGNEEKFIHEWRTFAAWTKKNQPGCGDGYLVQDTERPQRFISFGSWESADAIGEWRSSPQFIEFLGNARKLCDNIQPQTLKLVASTL